jgi:hypothetical protein
MSTSAAAETAAPLRRRPFDELALQRAVADDWPYTRRPLPWLLAGFLAMLWFVPIDGVTLNVPLPIDAKIDRFGIMALVAGWMLFGGDKRPRGRRPLWFLGMLGTYVVLAFTSLFVNIERVVRLGAFDLSTKKLSLLLAFAIFAWFTTNAMRPSELKAFARYTVWCGALSAMLVLIEHQTGYNVFYNVFGAIFKPIATVAPSPTVIHPDPTVLDRPAIVGPTEHGLAVATMLCIALPFAIVGLLEATKRSTRIWHLLAVGMMVGAAMATERKTAVVLPIVVILVFLYYRPKQMVKMWPMVFVLVAFIHVASPGALGTITEFSGFLNTDSTQGRTSDYSASGPDLVTRPILGFGFGSNDIAQYDTYRILDNEYLGELLQVGFLGAVAYLAMIMAAMGVAHRAIRSGDPMRAGPALAASAGCAAYMAASGLFDILSFPQAPYMFMYAAAFCTVAGTGLAPAWKPRDQIGRAPAARRAVASAPVGAA